MSKISFKYVGLLFVFLLNSCSKEDISVIDVEEKTNEEVTALIDVFNLEKLPQLHLSFTVEEWNKLLAYYDEDKDNKNFVKCNILYEDGEDSFELVEIGARIRGAWSRRRPEGDAGQFHVKDSTDWHHCSFALDFNEYVKGDDHMLGEYKKLDLKYFNIDPAYVREIYIYDLYRRFGIETAIQSSYCRLTVEVEGDSSPAYYGVYQMMEHINKQYLKDRKKFFGDAKGNLWKCGKEASLANSADSLFFVDDNSTLLHNYELKTNEDKFVDAKAELNDFIDTFQSLQGNEFHDWITSRCDVKLLLRTYAVNVACGNWDDYWNNKNNYYIYFNSSHEFFFIPFDLDNSLGICVRKNVAQDTGRTDPFRWGLEECNLISKLLQYPDFKAMYSDALKELIDPANQLFDYSASADRINKWWNLIRNYIVNDTGEHNDFVDSPTFGTLHKEYRLVEDSENNYFRVRSNTIQESLNNQK